jgi:plastocyanin
MARGPDFSSAAVDPIRARRDGEHRAVRIPPLRGGLMPVPADRLGRLPTVVLALVVPLVALVTVLVTLNATSDRSTAAPGGTGGAGRSGTAIAIKNFQYSPNSITVAAGTKLTVTNDDGTAHTLTADDKKFDTGTLDGGATKTITLSSPGTYTYHCDIHNYMTGRIVVR